MGKFLASFVVCMTLVCAGLFHSSARADEKPPVAQSPNTQTKVGRLGTLSLRPATKGNGAIAVFSRLKPLDTSCSGSCSGVSVGDWQCAGDYSCALDCTTTPPRKYCVPTQ